MTATAASWACMGKADDDAFVQPSHAADLDIQARMGSWASSAFMWTVDWRVSLTRRGGPTCGFADTIEIHDDAAYLARVASQNRNGRGVCNDTYRGPRRWLPHGSPHANATGPYPFSAGPLEIFGIDLARRVFLAPEVLLLCSSQRFFFGQRAARGDNHSPIWGEDPVIGYLAHYAASQRFSYLLHHHVDEAPQLAGTRGGAANQLRLELRSSIAESGRGLYQSRQADARLWARARLPAQRTSKFRRCFRPFALERGGARAHAPGRCGLGSVQADGAASPHLWHALEPHCGRTEARRRRRRAD